MMQQSVPFSLLDEEHKVGWKWVSEDPLKEPDYQEIMIC